MSLRKKRNFTTAAALSCLLGACGAEQRPPSEGTGGAGGAVGGAGATPGGSAGNAGVGNAGVGNAGGGNAGGGNAGAGNAGAGNAGAGNAGAGNAGAGNAGVGNASGGSGGSGGTAGTEQGGATFTVTSPAFQEVLGCAVENPAPCAVFPDENVSYMGNANISPELSWTGAPAGTQSFAVVLLDATFGQAHWVVWNIPADVTMLAANIPQDTAMLSTPAGAQQANANFATEGGEDGYFGPHVPCNVFTFEVYALSLGTFSPMDPDSAVLVAIELQELGEPLLGLAKLSGRSNDYGMTCQ